METKKIYDLHREHVEWLSKLSFYADEIKIMDRRIAEVVTKNNQKDILAEAEHFQNQLILQKEQIDILRHDIKKHEVVIETNIDANPIASDRRKLPDHKEQSAKMEMFEKIFTELRREFEKFLAKVL
jgi:hypothetical protein